MENKRIGLFVGRFQPFHSGHFQIIEKMASECDLSIIGIGSAFSSISPRNPLTYEIRRIIIREALRADQDADFKKKFLIIPIRDRQKVSNDPGWLDFLMGQVTRLTHEAPTVVYQGNDPERKAWYDGHHIEVVNVDRAGIKVSGTEMREQILRGNQSYWDWNCAPNTKELYPFIRKKILQANGRNEVV